MKKLNLLLIMIIVYAFANAQTSPDLNNAISSLKNGYLDEAKMFVDKAEENPKTSDSYKTFYYKGMIYQAISISDNPNYQILCTNCVDIAYEAYLKAIRLNFIKQEYRNLDLTLDADMLVFINVLQQQDDRNYESTVSLSDILRVRFPALSNAFINLGVAKYQIGDFESAYLNFEKAILISTLSFNVDGELYYLASLAALKTQRFEDVISLTDLLIQLDYGNNDKDKVGTYFNQAIAYKGIGDNEKMISTLDKGIEKFPTANYPLIIEMFNYYVKTGEDIKAYEYINLAIEKNKSDAQFYVIRGSLSESLNKINEAQMDYEKALSIQPDNFDANLNLGALLYNYGVDTLKFAENSLPVTDTKGYEKYKLIANEYYAQSLPYLEKANALKPNDLKVLTTLKTIYYRLGQLEKYNYINEKIQGVQF